MNNEEYNTKKWSLKACRVNEKLSREEVAQRLGISVVTVISHENGKGIPLYSQLEKYSQIYQVPIDKINSEYR
ncbi:helix-turn-helix domain-containing protein [Lacrimispora saccharolytica]|uniref:Helix-turn-helix transcriptional regulator n=1 Tax=Jingyaoa shaoxingensis TaxID=2763671 RepID=A0ABR7NE81_9FIRM|nr:helix-turn-helix transcriptional regulator [Jingyaoa shaoxingensis]MBC8574711.1 helix-turn-helix transcriptional regulator [Jingyaoa shaoxingensis]MCQ4775356.1 helix-turn-helix domain-containing protein [Lacrimispora saccharolytica]